LIAQAMDLMEAFVAEVRARAQPKANALANA
jgi:hypothetical protein